MPSTNRSTAAPTKGPSFASIRSAEDDWEIDLFRFSDSYGWQKQAPVLSSSSDTNGSGSNKSTRKATNVVLKAIPRNNCIVIPAIRQKITLSSTATEAFTTSNTNHKEDATSKNVANGGSVNDRTASRNTEVEQQVFHDKSCVVRRGDCILLINRRRTRAMVLKFRSLDSCLSFSDRFVQLNPWPTGNTDTTSNRGAAASKNTASSNSGGRTSNSNQARLATQQQQQQEQQEVVSYIARLMHEPDFLQLVHKIENLVANTTDGSKMLEALETRDLTASSLP